MKKFIITSLLAVSAIPVLACMGIGTNNYYLFNAYVKDDFSNRMQEVCNNNWKAYLGIGEDQWFYFNAEEVEKAALQKDDALMASYVRHLARYLECASEVSAEAWDYPTQEQLAKREQALKGIRVYAFSKLKTRLRSQHALLYMRCNMLLKRHQDNITFWEQTASQYIETVYKDMMANIYAGALYKTGNVDKAGELFAQQGDYQSLMTIYYKKRSYAAIRQEYEKNPNALVLPFLLQDFVNNAQEADDVNNPNAEGIGGKLFIRDITKAEAMQMVAFCQQVINEGKTETPAMWMAAKAWLGYMFGNKQEAMKDIRQAANMKGTERMEETARILRIYMAADLKEKGAEFDNWVGPELEWLYGKAFAEQSPDYYSFYHNAYTRILHQVLGKRYEKEGRMDVALALMKTGNSPKYAEFADTASVAQLMEFLAYQDKPATNKLEVFLKNILAQQKKNENPLDMKDLIGSKYLRVCEWQKAIEWFQQVPASYYNDKGYAVYAANRKVNVEPWLKRQLLPLSLVWGDTKWTFRENPKLVFAREMLSMEVGLNVLNGKARQQRCYDLAVRYAQINMSGDCWYFLHDTKSLYFTLPKTETDLAARALQLLREASQTTDAALKERALFALCYGELRPEEQRWFKSEWSSEESDYVIIPQQGTAQWKAFAALADFEKNNQPSTYVTRCDEYRLFRKQSR